MTSAQRIFISYRRSDCQSQANGLNDGLRNRMPDAQVFMDLDSIPPGADFEEHIRSEIDQCDVVLVMIGDEWLEPDPVSGGRRIDDPNDFVRLEVLSSLSNREVRVIPVLVEGARMPGASQLPEDIARLARLNAFELSDSRWGRDLEMLTDHLRGKRQPETESKATVSFADIDADAVKYAVASLPAKFATKDVSTHPAMLATHEGVATRSNYHTMVGRYLMQHRVDLSLGSPEAPRDDRGSRWSKAPTSAPPPVVHRQPTPRPFTPTPPPPPHATAGKTSAAGKWMIALPIISCGLLGFIPPLWAATRVKHDPARQRRLYIVGAALGVATLLAFALIGTSPTNADGTSTGPAADAGAVLVLACLVVGVVIAVKNRNPAPALAGTEGELARRDLQRQYRELVGRDPGLAASMRVGRPDLTREYDDGGLVDLNSLPPEGLQRFAGMSSSEAAEVLRMRGELGRISGLNELEAFSTVSPGTIARLREVAVFL